MGRGRRKEQAALQKNYLARAAAGGGGSGDPSGSSGGPSGSSGGPPGSSGGQRDYTLSVSVSGPGRAILKVDGVEASSDAAGSHQIPAGAQVQLSGRARSGGAWVGWNGMPSRGNTCLFYMTSDISVSGEAVAKDKAPKADKPDPLTDSNWVDPLGRSRPEQEEFSRDLAEALLREAGIENAAELADALRDGHFSADALAEASQGLSPEAAETLAALRPSVTSRMPSGMTPEEGLQWLRGDRSLILDPELSVPGTRAAAEALSGAIDDGKKIGVFVDYDVDGIASGEILRESLQSHGAEVEMGYADLDNGFGLNEDFVRRAHEAGCEVLITADCGSASEEAVALAQSLGMQVFVTDHHETAGHEDNPADFHLNPDLHDSPAAGNTGSQVAWKLATALHEERGGVPEEHFEQSLWWAGFGARADGGNLLDGENRAFMHNEHMPEGVRELGQKLIEHGHHDKIGSDMSDLDATRMAINIGKRLDHIETVETEPVQTKGNAKKGQPPLPEHRHVYDPETREYRDMGQKTRVREGGRVVSREDFSPEDVARALSHPDPQVREEAQEKVIRALDYLERLQDEARDTIASEMRETWKADDGTLVRDPAMATVPHIIMEDERMSGISRPVANALQSHTRSPSVAFVPAGQDEEGAELFKFSATPVHGQGTAFGEAMSEVEDVCVEVGGHSQVFGGVCRREDIPEVMSRLNTWAEAHGDVAPEKVTSSSGNLWASERLIDSGAELAGAERGRDMLAPYTESYDDYDHFGPTVSVVGRVSDFRSPPDGTDAKGNKVQAASRSRTHYAILEMEDGTRREVKVSSRKDLDTLREAQDKYGKLEIALRLESGAHSVRGIRPRQDVPF